MSAAAHLRSHLHPHPHIHPLEVVETVLEVADVAWAALERRHERAHSSSSAAAAAAAAGEEPSTHNHTEEELNRLREENLRLKDEILANQKVFDALQKSLAVSKDCPPDLYERLLASVDSSNYLGQLNMLQSSADVNENCFLKEAKGTYLVNIELEEPSWWVWVTDEIASSEEACGIDDESYVIVSEELVVDGIANFIARCIILNPKSQKLKPEELQKIVSQALGGMNNKEKLKRLWNAGKLLYTLATWGIALTGLYRHRIVLKAAATGIRLTSKVIMKAF